ncbi:MarR family winged helix-turn-helix transcriptional regulator [Clostridium sp. BJN0013]|uniref:MarR family winged helix-turn-helix transcriptional regulator n=1 Tax=Clostridium sp. BJN0013 TaxID=3236840 RepID=UPI0034C5E720
MACNQNSLNIWISILYRYRKNYMNKRLEAYGRASSFSLLILSIYKNDGINQEQISALLKVDKGSIARAIKKLEQENYVRREDDVTDKRANKVYLTPKALALVPEIQSAIVDWNKQIMAGIPVESQKIFLNCIEQMSKNACNTCL